MLAPSGHSKTSAKVMATSRHTCNDRQCLHCRGKPVDLVAIYDKLEKAETRHGQRARDLSPSRTEKLSKRELKQAKKQSKRQRRLASAEAVLHKFKSTILDIRSQPEHGKHAEYLVQFPEQADVQWVHADQIPDRVRAAYTQKRDIDDTYPGYNDLPQELRQQCMQHKYQCNVNFGKKLVLAVNLNGLDIKNTHHVALIHPGESCCTSQLMTKFGVPPANIHQPNPFAFAKCCGQGFPNIYPCLLSNLPARLNVPITSAMLDLCGCCAAIEEAFAFFRAAVFTHYCAFALTLSHCRHRPNANIPDSIPAKVQQMLAEIGYVIEGEVVYHAYKVSTKRAMYNWCWLIRRADAEESDDDSLVSIQSEDLPSPYDSEEQLEFPAEAHSEQEPLLQPSEQVVPEPPLLEQEPLLVAEEPLPQEPAQAEEDEEEWEEPWQEESMHWEELLEFEKEAPARSSSPSPLLQQILDAEEEDPDKVRPEKDECSCDDHLLEYHAHAHAAEAIPYLPLIQVFRCFLETDSTHLISLVHQQFPNCCLTKGSFHWIAPWGQQSHWTVRVGQTLVDCTSLGPILWWLYENNHIGLDPEEWIQDHFHWYRAKK